jgi:hypothetical protein
MNMRLSLGVLAVTGVLVFTSALSGQRVTGVDPLTAKAGDTVIAKGEGIAKPDVDTFYLTDGKTDWKCEVVSQTATAITFKVPPEIKPGRWAVMVHTNKDQLIELPVKLTVI